MTLPEQTEAFRKELWKLIDRFNEEFDIELETFVCELAHAIVVLTIEDEEED